MSIFERYTITRWDYFRLKVKRKFISIRYWLAKKLLPENQWTFLENPQRQVKTYLLDESRYCSREAFLEIGARKIKKGLVVDMIEELTSYAKMDVKKANGDGMVECRATLRVIR